MLQCPSPRLTEIKMRQILFQTAITRYRDN
jgi:hypothetical protein